MPTQPSQTAAELNALLEQEHVVHCADVRMADTGHPHENVGITIITGPDGVGMIAILPAHARSARSTNRHTDAGGTLYFWQRPNRCVSVFVIHDPTPEKELRTLIEIKFPCSTLDGWSHNPALDTLLYPTRRFRVDRDSRQGNCF